MYKIIIKVNGKRYLCAVQFTLKSRAEDYIKDLPRHWKARIVTGRILSL